MFHKFYFLESSFYVKTNLCKPYDSYALLMLFFKDICILLSRHFILYNLKNTTKISIWNYCNDITLISALYQSAGPVTIDPLEVLTNSNFSYQDLFFTLHHQAQKSMFLHVDVDPATDQQCLADALHPFCSKMGNVLYLKPVSNSVFTSTNI